MWRENTLFMKFSFGIPCLQDIRADIDVELNLETPRAVD